MYPAVIKSFVKQYLMPGLHVPVDLDRIIPVRTESVDTKLRTLYSDLIFELNTFSDKPVYLLFEHKSYPDKDIEKQLIKYMDTFELDYLKEHSETKTSLIIIPILIYHGSYYWNIVFSHSRLADLKFFDLSRIPDEQIRGSVILRIVLLTLKYISSEEIVTKIDTIFELFKELKDDREAKEYVRSFSFYVEHAAREELREMLVQKMEHFFSNEELESSTVVRELEERGKEKGIDIGVEATKLILTSDKSDEQIAKDTGLSAEKIREIREKIRNES